MISRIASSLLVALVAMAPAHAAKVKVLTTLPDFRDIAVQIGGDRVEATSLLKGPEDPHFVDAKPSFIRAANQADLFIMNGMELEIGYEPMIVAESRNPSIQPGTPGHCDVSVAVHKLEVPQAIIDRARGDVHPAGNPHYMLDPVNGKLVAQTIRDHLKLVDPSGADAYDRSYDAFVRKVDEAMFGPKILSRFRASDLEELLAQGTLLPFLKKRGADADLAGWAAALAPFAGSRIVDYHAGGSRYVADRFHFEVLASLENKPGIAPSLSHLGEVVQTMKARSVKALLYSAYNKKSNVDWVTSQTGVSAAMLAHSVGALPGTDDYISMMNRNVEAVRQVLSRP
ncbi:MAG: zinc ABC transporter substrate-binding protein [Planctomycetes bacterium]|nr:zinc ABC transporter substrate-binding protein [Planctomycetota bacterium]